MQVGLYLALMSSAPALDHHIAVDGGKARPFWSSFLSLYTFRMIPHTTWLGIAHSMTCFGCSPNSPGLRRPNTALVAKQRYVELVCSQCFLAQALNLLVLDRDVAEDVEVQSLLPTRIMSAFKLSKS